MILQVPFEQFGPTVKRVLKTKEVFVSPRGATTLATAASDNRLTVVVSLNKAGLEDTRSDLERAEFEVFEGCWHTEEVLETGTDSITPYVAAVAYASQEGAPGLWVDAYESLPTQIAVLRSLYDEFRETGQVAEVSFEEFVRLAQPTVVITTPAELHSYVDQHRTT